MECHEILTSGYEGVLKVLENAVDGMSEEDLNWQPRSDCNSIGWLVWHLTRWHDVMISSFMGEEELWVKDRWHERFGQSADDGDHGSGHDVEDLAVFKSPDAATLIGYHQAVLERSKQYFPSISATDMDRETESMPFKKPPKYEMMLLPEPKVGLMLMRLLSGSLQHAGQASYVRGLHEGKGWQPF